MKKLTRNNLKFPLIFLAVFTTACSKTPSNSEIKSSLEKEAQPNCDMIEFENVQKINGIEISPTQYRVKANYDVTIKPNSELKDVWINLTTRKERAKQLLAQLTDEENSIRKKYDTKELEKELEDTMRKTDDENIKEKINKIQDKIYEMNSASNSAYAIARDNYNHALTIEKLLNIDYEYSSFYLKTKTMIERKCGLYSFTTDIIEKIIKDNLVEGVVYGAHATMTSELNFIKTENGWVLKL